MKLHDIQNVLSKTEYVSKMQQNMKHADELQQQNLAKELIEQNNEKKNTVKKIDEADLIEISIHDEQKQEHQKKKKKKKREKKEEHPEKDVHSDEIYDRHDHKRKLEDGEGKIIDVKL